MSICERIFRMNKERIIDKSNPSIKVSDQAMAEAFKIKGNDFFKQKEYHKAIECYTKAINISMRNEVYFANRAFCYLELKQYNECVQDCTFSIVLNPNYIKPFYRRMQAYEHLGEYEKAFKDCETVLNNDPSDVKAKATWMRLRNKLKKNSDEEEFQTNFVQAPYNDDDDDKIDVLEDKPVHLRSQKPLRRIDIVEVDDEESLTTKTTNIIEDFAEKIEIKTVEDNLIKSKEENLAEGGAESIATTSGVVKTKDISYLLDLSPPKTVARFYITWRCLTDEKKYMYLKLIDPAIINTLLGASFNSKTLSEIIAILSNYYINNGDKVGELLYNISLHHEMPILSCFMTENEKTDLRKLIDHMQKQNDTDYVEEIKQRFSL